MIKNIRIKWALQKALRNPKFTNGRSLLRLAVMADLSRIKTKEILKGMGARKVTLKVSGKEIEGYTLRKRK